MLPSSCGGSHHIFPCNREYTGSVQLSPTLFPRKCRKCRQEKGRATRNTGFCFTQLPVTQPEPAELTCFHLFHLCLQEVQKYWNSREHHTDERGHTQNVIAVLEVFVCSVKVTHNINLVKSNINKGNLSSWYPKSFAFVEAYIVLNFIFFRGFLKRNFFWW